MSIHFVSRRVIGLVSLSAFLTAAGAAVAQPGIYGFGLLPGGPSSSATHVSPDGSVATGIARIIPPPGTQVMRWSLGTGTENLGGPGAANLPTPTGISAGGERIVGRAFISD